MMEMDPDDRINLASARALIGIALLAGPGAPDGVALRADALPASVWGSNLRGILSARQWDDLRIPVVEAAGGRCEACAARPARGQRPDCHEQWAFDLVPQGAGALPVPVQRLVRLVALCKGCHRVQHTGLAGLRGEMDLVRRHLARINHWSPAQVTTDLERARRRHDLLEVLPWDLDLRVLAGQITLPGWPELVIPADGRSRLGNSLSRPR